MDTKFVGGWDLNVNIGYNEHNHINCADCRTALRFVLGDSIDLIVTSPPYKEEDGYSKGLIRKVAWESYRILKPDNLCFVNFGHFAGHKKQPFEVAETFEGVGFEWVDTIIWIKNHFSPIQGSKRLNNLFEYVFLFAKGKDYKLDRLSIGVPYQDKSNIGRYSDVDLRCGGNIWYIDYETITNKGQKKHPHRFPVELPSRCIKLAGLESGSVVLDPFMGGGTTAVAAQRLGMGYLGFEKNPKFVKDAIKWLEEEKEDEVN